MFRLCQYWAAMRCVTAPLARGLRGQAAHEGVKGKHCQYKRGAGARRKERGARSEGQGQRGEHTCCCSLAYSGGALGRCSVGAGSLPLPVLPRLQGPPGGCVDLSHALTWRQGLEGGGGDGCVFLHKEGCSSRATWAACVTCYQLHVFIEPPSAGAEEVYALRAARGWHAIGQGVRLGGTRPQAQAAPDQGLLCMPAAPTQVTKSGMLPWAAHSKLEHLLTDNVLACLPTQYAPL